MQKPMLVGVGVLLGTAVAQGAACVPAYRFQGTTSSSAETSSGSGGAGSTSGTGGAGTTSSTSGTGGAGTTSSTSGTGGAASGAGGGCAGGLLCDDGKCHDVSSDDANCGACSTTGASTACADGTKCSAGQCLATCGTGTMLCGTTCVAVQSDPGNCGGCGTACTAGQVCLASACAYLGPEPSYASPGGTATTSAHAVDIDFALASPGPSTIYYTKDGSTPVPGMGTTASGPSPVVLTKVPGAGAGTTLRWYADYGGTIGPEPIAHTMVVTTPGPGNNQGALVDHVNLAGTGRPVIVVAPGASVSATLDLQVWKDGPSGGCPGCVVQWYVGVDGGVGQVACISVPSAYPGSTSTQSFTFNAPMTPGRYAMRHGLAEQFNCAGAGYGGGEEVAEIIVAN